MIDKDIVMDVDASRDYKAIENLSSITEISWCAYSIKENKVTIDETITFSQDIKLPEAIKKFTDFVFREIIMQNYAFKLIVEGDWVIKV